MENSASPYKSAPNKAMDADTTPASSGSQNSEVSKINWELASRSELIRCIGILTDQSNKYERRFKDVVKAYKGLQNERDALESSLKAALLSNPAQSIINEGTDSSHVSSTETEDSPYGGANFEEQIFLLTKAVSTLTEEKANLLSDYQADKKQSLIEYENERHKLMESYNQAEKDISNLIVEKQYMVQEITNLKRDKSLSEKKLYESESKLREQTENLNLLEQKLNELSLRESKEKEEYMNKDSEVIKPLREKLQQNEEELKKLKGRLSEADTILSEYHIAIDESQKKYSILEEELINTTRQKDERVESLEEQIRELSNTVGSYQVTTTEQEHKINELTQNNQPQVSDFSLLSKIPINYTNVLNDVSTAEAITKLSEQESKLRSTLQIMLRHFLPKSKLTIDHICSISKTELLEHISTHKINQQMKTDNEILLKDYKAKCNTLEEDLKIRNEEFLLQTEKTNQAQEMKINDLTSEFQKRELEYKSKLNELENKFLACRDETSEQLADKESEISRLKSKCLSTSIITPLVRDKQNTESILQELISVNGYHSDSNASFHFSQIKQRQRAKQKASAQELEELRLSIIDLEYRDIQHLEQISFLQNEILRLDNNSSRQSVNSEYLKNIILQYVTATQQQQHELIPAISSVLKLNKGEINKIKLVHKMN